MKNPTISAMKMVVAMMLVVVLSSTANLWARPVLAQTPTPTPTQTPTPRPTNTPIADAKLTVPLAMVRVGDQQTVKQQWSATQIKALLLAVNTIWAQAQINFTWPEQPTFHDVDDPDTTQSNAQEGDVLVGAGKGSAEEQQVCNSARDANSGKLGVGLVQHFVDPKPTPNPPTPTPEAKPKSNQNAFFLHNTTVGPCIVLSIQVKANPSSLAHELGHALGLGHDDSQDNLMYGVKADRTGTKLQGPQITVARAGVPALLANLQKGVGGIAELPAVAGTPLAADGSSGASAGVLAGAIAGAVLVVGVTLGGAAWYTRRRLIK